MKLSVSNTGTVPAVKPTDPDMAYTVDGVRQHFDTLLPFTDYRDPKASSFSCVDSRGEARQLGTLGGDIAELAAGIHAYLKVMGVAPANAAAAVKPIFRAFMAEVATPERPFYYHTSDEKLQKVFKSINAAGADPKITVFPETMPANNVDLWMTKLATGDYQGCGHMRLMIDMWADYGLDSPDIPQALIKAFFDYWWPTAPGSVERSKVMFKILQGPLTGKAVAIVDSVGACPGMAPITLPSHGGSQVFVYHGKAVDDFRTGVLGPFFVNYAKKQGKTLDQAKFLTELKSLQGKHLGATLTNLAPANSLELFTVSITTQDASGVAMTALNTANAQNSLNTANARKNVLNTGGANANKNNAGSNANKSNGGANKSNGANANKNNANANKNNGGRRLA
ncbi:MAG: hypothetical protein J3K34DRAFT_422397 [Monoraphidium minutum]|nr:MAG: hypothetical protein J3K34DRAFT_422397 [Monoraphidium minutum]